MIIYKNLKENSIRNEEVTYFLVKCDCKHKKSDHGKQGCVITGCGCRNFKVVKKREKDEERDTVNSITGFHIDTRKLFSTDDKPAGKHDETVARRSDVRDSDEQTFTEISQLGSDYKQKIIEYNKIIKNDQHDEDKRRDAWISKGICLRLDDRAAESLQCFEYVLLKDEKNIIALKHLGFSYEALGKFHDAIEKFQKIMDIDGAEEYYLNEIAICYSDSKVAEYDEAITYLARVLDIDKKNKLAYDNMGFCYEMKEEYPAALKAFKKSGDYYSQRHMADIYFMTDKYDKALEIGNKLIKDGEANSRTYYIVGNILGIEQEKYDQAIPLLKKSLSLKEASGTYFDLGFCYLQKKMFHLSSLYFEKRLEFRPSDDAIGRANLGICYEGTGQHKSAQKCFETALKIDPKVWMLRGLLESLHNNGQNDLVIKKYDEYVSKNPKFSEYKDVLRVMIHAQNALGQNDDALEFSNKLLDLSSDMEPGMTLSKEVNVDSEITHRDYVWRGFIFTHLQPPRYENAYECFHKATEISPEDTEAYRFWGIALFEDKKYPEAKEKFQKSYELSKSDEDLLWKGKAIKKIGNYTHDNSKTKEAEEIFDSILESTTQSGQAMLEKGNCNWNLGKKNIAEDCWLKACKIIPDNAEVWCNLGDVNESDHEALMFYEEALLCDESYVDAHYGKGSSYYNLEQWSDAIKCYDRVLELEDNYDEALFNKANCLGFLKKYVDAIKCYDDFIEKFPESHNLQRVWRRKAWSQNGMKEYASALDSCNTAFEMLKIQTNYKPVTDSSGRHLVDDNEKLQKKRRTANLKFTYEERAKAYEGLEQYEDAIKDYKKVLRKDYAWPLWRIIHCLGQLGHIIEQKEYRKKLRDAEGDDDDAPA